MTMQFDGPFDGAVCVPLSKGYHALVDAEDFEKIADKSWCYSGGYARAGKVAMHRFLLNDPEGFVVDHKNRVKLDNRKSNLRVATRSQNTVNFVRKRADHGHSEYRVVLKYGKRWSANIGFENGYYRLGVFDTELEAARMYDDIAIVVHGEFAHTNFPRDMSERDKALYGLFVRNREHTDYLYKCLEREVKKRMGEES